MSNEYELINHLKIRYINIFLVQLKYRTPHYHNEMELGIILRGKLLLKKGGKISTLNENDIFILNPGEAHELLSEEESVLILSIQLSPKFFAGYFPSMKALQFLESNIYKLLPEQVFEEISANMYKLACAYFEQTQFFEFQCIIAVNQLIYTLVNNIPYKILTVAEQETLLSRIGRLKRIIEYTEENYNRKLLLQEIADSERLSLSYMSHFIKEMLGMSFQDYLNHVRLEHAVHMIETTKQSILDISMENGFSDIRYLNKLFLLRYGCTPKQHRKNKNMTRVAATQSGASFQQILSQKESLEILKDKLKK